MSQVSSWGVLAAFGLGACACRVRWIREEGGLDEWPVRVAVNWGLGIWMGEQAGRVVMVAGEVERSLIAAPHRRSC